jgi:hypothetical protein
VSLICEQIGSETVENKFPGFKMPKIWVYRSYVTYSRCLFQKIIKKTNHEALSVAKPTA